MAMRCFGRAFGLTAFVLTADTPRALDVVVLRDEDLAAILWPAHFFRTAVLAAAFEVAFFCLGIGASLLLMQEANTDRISVG